MRPVPSGRDIGAQEHLMERVEVFHLLQGVLFAQQPFLVAELNPVEDAAAAALVRRGGDRVF